MAHVRAGPAAIAATSVSPVTVTGVEEVSVVPLPSCPDPFAPQQRAVPSLIAAQLWALPAEDQTVAHAHEALKPKLKQPKKLSDVVADELGEDSDYLAVFIPGGHGALIGLPDSELVAETLDWALNRERYIITLCHGPAALLSVGQNGRRSPFAGYSMCVFPDALDEGVNVDMGYIPGHLQWLLAESSKAQGITVLNDDMTGKVHQDRKLLSGDSPLAANNLGLLAADVLVKAAATAR